MIGVFLMNFGGPSANDPATIEQYIYNILADRANWPWAWGYGLQPRVARAIARRRARVVTAQYAHLGGSSPLLRITQSQADKLSRALTNSWPQSQVFVGMQYWSPVIEEVTATIATRPLTDLVLIPLYPHGSYTTSDTCLARAATTWRRRGDSTVRVHHCDAWYAHPRYIDLCADLLRTTVTQFADPATVHILFTAHSLPQSIVDRGDPYPHQVRAQIASLLSISGLTNSWSLGFQSRLGPIRWLEPDVETCIAASAQRGVQALCLMPLSFVTDQLETLYEVDVTYIAAAAAHGISEVRRVPVVNDHPTFIAFLTTLVEETLAHRT